MIWKRNCVLCWINNLKRGRREESTFSMVFSWSLPFPSWARTPSRAELITHPGFILISFLLLWRSPFPSPLFVKLLRLRKGLERTMPEGYSKSSLPKREVLARTFPFRQVPLGQEGAGFVNIHPPYQVRSPKFKKRTEASDRRSIWGGWAVGSIPWVPTLFLSQADTYIGYALLWWREEDSERHHGFLGTKKNLNWTSCNSKWTIS